MSRRFVLSERSIALLAKSVHRRREKPLSFVSSVFNFGLLLSSVTP